jgi:hypothetical protein
VPTPPVELLDGANEPKLTLLHQVLHVEPLANESTGVGDHETKIGPHKFVHCALGLPAATGECPPRSGVSAARAQSSTHSVEERTLESLDAELGSDSRAATTHSVTGRLVALRRANDGRRGSALQQAHEPANVVGGISILRGVAKHRRRKDAPVAQIPSQGAKRASRLGRTEQSL